MKTFEKKVLQNAEQNGLPISPGKRLLVGVSGGADSVALLCLLQRAGCAVVAAHCNFGLRGEESMRDEAFVRQLCSRMGVLLEVKTFDVQGYMLEHKGASVEMSCRELRYGWFAELKAKHGIEWLAVAHHRDDNVETFFLNAIRGTGIAGLKGMQAVSNGIVRPLLCVSRAEIEAYLNEIGEQYVVDSTNLESEFSRNKLRNIVLPVMEQALPGATEGINRTIEATGSCFELYSELVENAKASVMTEDARLTVIDVASLKRYKAWRVLLFEILKGYGFNALQAGDLCDAIAESGKMILSQQYRAIVSRGKIEISPLDCDVAQECELTLADVPQQRIEGIEVKIMPVAEFSLEMVDGKKAICFDADALLAATNGQLKVRTPHEGDRFVPFGMQGSRKLSDFFNDAKVGDYEKRTTRILTDPHGKILWVVGKRATNHFRVGKSTKRVMVMMSE